MIGRVSTRGFYAGVSFILVGTMALGGCEHLPGASALTPTFLAKSVDKRPADPLLLGPLKESLPKLTPIWLNMLWE